MINPYYPHRPTTIGNDTAFCALWRLRSGPHSLSMHALGYVAHSRANDAES